MAVCKAIEIFGQARHVRQVMDLSVQCGKCRTILEMQKDSSHLPWMVVASDGFGSSVLIRCDVSMTGSALKIKGEAICTMHI
jgi:hypothetical protein